MILDRLDNWQLYFSKESLAGRGFQWLQDSYDPSITEGKIPILDDDLFALPQGYETRDPEKARFEGHRRYLDIQFVLRGAETMGWAAAEELEVDEEYDSERDLIWYRRPSVYTPLRVAAGHFALFYPGDAHAPCLRCEGFDTVFKVVFKVRV